MLKNEKNVELARKIMLELPEQLAPQLGSAETEKGQLKLFPLPRYSKLQSIDIRLISGIIRSQFKGEYVNEKERFYWLLPLPDLPLPANAFGDNVVVASPAGPAPPIPEPASVLNDAKTSSAPALVSQMSQPSQVSQMSHSNSGNKVTESQSNEVTQEPEKPKEEPKQPSPLAVFMTRYCSTCADQSDGCNPKNAVGREKMQHCYEVLRILFLGDIRDNLLKPKPYFQRRGSNSSSRPQGQQSNSQPQQPETFFLENGIVWANSQTNNGKSCHKAYEDKNCKNGALTSVFAILRQEVDAKKGFGGFYYYRVKEGQRPYIGRIKTEKENEQK